MSRNVAKLAGPEIEEALDLCLEGALARRARGEPLGPAGLRALRQLHAAADVDARAASRLEQWLHRALLIDGGAALADGPAPREIPVHSLRPLGEALDALAREAAAIAALTRCAEGTRVVEAARYAHEAAASLTGASDALAYRNALWAMTSTAIALTEARGALERRAAAPAEGPTA